jgi:glycerophosphoryl diester phosphodiesterase
LRSAPDLAFLTARPFAHRGLHGGGRSENGMAAFGAAIAAGFGIECDVRSSSDGVAMVFHDATLDRLTGEAGRFGDRTARALCGIALRDGGGIPRLADLLALTASTATPLLVEIKVDGRRVEGLCAAVLDDIGKAGDAPVAIMSFNPLVARWFAAHTPDGVRGLVVTQRDRRGLRGAIARALALRFARPDFLACDISDLPSPFAARARAHGLPVLSWTVRSPDERARAARHADQIIFEEHRP